MSSAPLYSRVARTIARIAVPSHRRWRATLRSCTLRAELASERLGPRDAIVCGCPRSGTALLAASLFQPPKMVTVMEPWDGLRVAPSELFSSVRGELAGGALARGRLQIDDLRDSGSVAWQRDGERTFSVDATDETVLAVKWPCYWQLLGVLPSTKFIVCVRDPAEVVASFAAKGGRLAQGLEYDVAFNQELNDSLLAAYSTDQARRIGLYDAVYERVLAHAQDPNVLLVRYEHWFQNPSALLEEISAFLNVDVTNSLARITAPSPERDQGEAKRIRATSTTAERLGYR